MGAVEDKYIGRNGSVSAKCVQNGLTPGRVCFVTTFQENAGYGYPAVWSAAQVVIKRRQHYPSQQIRL